ncbi:MAG: 4-alpha-glucanotransferase [Pseudomonadota bacterium]|nr:4-alpha-glucanotransferase [Pseudomonadota bacterium]
MITEQQADQTFFGKRRAGVLLHPTSLPGIYGSGDLGHDAYRFVEFLQECGFSVWQMLPLGPTHEDGSPYQSLSAHAGNPLLISIDWLVDRGWLNLQKITVAPGSSEFRRQCLLAAFEVFEQQAAAVWKQRLADFCQQQSWLNDYALFMAIKHEQYGRPWMQWPVALRSRDKKTLKQVAKNLARDIARIEFEQFVFFTQWHEIRDYARQRGVLMFGDMPIFVAHDSADVWAHRKNFMLDETGEPVLVAGVPPDAFSATGQRWGNPLYDWAAMQSGQFDWWQDRFRTQLELFDLIRIDHFRGFEACWQIPAQEQTAVHGAWVSVPGRDLLETVRNKFPGLVLVAEDLGVITPEVDALRRDFSLPGMKILQFAFGGNADNPYLPHNHELLSVVYTGTHDNDTTPGWIESMPDNVRQHFLEYSGCMERDDITLLKQVVVMALASVSRLAILPMQDILELDSQHRMNTPGTTEGNWRWRFDWQQLQPAMRQKMQQLLRLYGRVVP